MILLCRLHAQLILITGYNPVVEKEDIKPVRESSQNIYKGLSIVEDVQDDDESGMNLLQQANVKLTRGPGDSKNMKKDEKLDNLILNTTRKSGHINKYLL